LAQGLCSSLPILAAMRAVFAAASLVFLAAVLCRSTSQSLFGTAPIHVSHGQVATAPVYSGSVSPYLQPLAQQYAQPVASAEPAWGLNEVALLAVGAMLGAAIVHRSNAEDAGAGASNGGANADLEAGRIIAALAVEARSEPARKLTDKVGSPGSIVTAGKPSKKAKTSFLQYEVCTLGGQEGDIGVLPPLGIWDPLGLIETKDMRRWEIMEIKHGRAAMLAFLHVIHVESGVRFPGYLSGSAGLKFTDVPSGLFASLEAVPKLGWLQILAVALACETGFAARPFGVTKQTADRAPGDIGASGWVRYSDPATRAFKLNVERQNGRAAMLGITGCLIHELLGVDALYPTGGLGGAAPPTIF